MKIDWSYYHNFLLSKVKLPISEPRVKMFFKGDMSGYYEHYEECIYISMCQTKENRIATYVHEWRHHWQYKRGKWRYAWKDGFMPKEYNFSTRNYKSQMVKYFIEQPWEIDALKFTLRHFYTQGDANIMNLINEYRGRKHG